ncbi:MAG: Na/Pi symporter [Myxococcota bacterium]|nr:Na/Pi symporter [Myxococcota bacterium]
MTTTLLLLAGGLGLFLLGMVTMTEGLRGLAGDALRRTLRRATRSPSSGALSGMLTTALVQSSSVTTVAAIGFAGAGLLSFPQALGIVFGANAGTTATGWMVAALGFKLELGAVMPAVILFGVLLRLFGPRRWPHLGSALCGFGLIFLGIEGLQSGMQGLSGVVTPDTFPDDTLVGRLQLVGIGAALTVVTQSSSAGVATALAAMTTGTISFHQAAAMVIGMDIGTTSTALLATVGASLPARRTGWAQVLYNLFTAAGALLLLTPYTHFVEWLAPGSLDSDAAFSLVGFHSFYNVLGVLAVVPAARRFAALVERLVPDRPGPFTQRLEKRLLVDPELALRATAPSLEELADRTLRTVGAWVASGGDEGDPSEQLALLALAVAEVEHYVQQIPADAEPVAARRTAAIQVVEQLRRLHERFEGRPEREVLLAEPRLREWSERLARLSKSAPPLASEAELSAFRSDLAHHHDVYRREITRQAGEGELPVAAALERLDAFRWLERVTHHGWRLTHHLGQLQQEFPTSIGVEPPEPG